MRYSMKHWGGPSNQACIVLEFTSLAGLAGKVTEAVRPAKSEAIDYAAMAFGSDDWSYPVETNETK